MKLSPSFIVTVRNAGHSNICLFTQSPQTYKSARFMLYIYLCFLLLIFFLLLAIFSTPSTDPNFICCFRKMENGLQ